MLGSSEKRRSKLLKKKSIYEDIEKKVLEVIEVPKDYHEELSEIIRILVEKIQQDLASLSVPGRVEVQGSFERRTYLLEETILDLMIIIPKTEKVNLYQILDALEERLSKDRLKKEPIRVKKITGKMPYLRIIAKGEHFHLFVGYEIVPGEKKLSVFDLVPLHTQYIRTHLSEKQRKEVLLLKRFLKSIRLYNDEIGAIGFNGYLCELLILFYGTFRKAIEGISEWKPRTIIDIKKGKEKFEDVDELTIELLQGYYPLYVLDPIDPRENVAANVSLEQFNSVVAAANIYLYNPDISFFEDLMCDIPSFELLNEKLQHAEKHLVVLALKREFQDQGVCWQKAENIQKAFEEELIKHYYLLDRIKAFVSDEWYGVLMSFMREMPQLTTRKEGPEITSPDAVEFLKKFSRHMDVVQGPFVDFGKWVVYFTKKGQHVYDFVYNLVKKNTFVLKVDSFLKLDIRNKMKIMTMDEELHEIYNTDATFAETLAVFIERKPLWLCNLEETTER